MRPIDRDGLLTKYRIFETKQFEKDLDKIKGKTQLKLREKLDNYFYSHHRTERKRLLNGHRLTDGQPAS